LVEQKELSVETDPFNLQRFVSAQAKHYEDARRELQRGRKETHWMWFVFPQIEGLGQSPTSKLYAIKSAAEARDYLQHPVLGVRLRECAAILLGLKGRSAHDIFGSPDDVKLRSSMTLFASVQNQEPAFARVLDKYFHGERDTRTLSLLNQDPSNAEIS
jgi:uncharacterized protein (DUF1810 family)